MISDTQPISKKTIIEQPYRRWVIEKAADLVAHVRRATMDAANEGLVLCAVFLSDKYQTLDWEEYARNNVLVVSQGPITGPVEKLGDTSLFYVDADPLEIVKLLCVPADLPPVAEDSKE